MKLILLLFLKNAHIERAKESDGKNKMKFSISKLSKKTLKEPCKVERRKIISLQPKRKRALLRQIIAWRQHQGEEQSPFNRRIKVKKVKIL